MLFAPLWTKKCNKISSHSLWDILRFSQMIFSNLSVFHLTIGVCITSYAKYPRILLNWILKCWRRGAGRSPNHFQWSIHFHCLRGTGSKIAVPGGICAASSMHQNEIAGLERPEKKFWKNYISLPGAWQRSFLRAFPISLRSSNRSPSASASTRALDWRRSSDCEQVQLQMTEFFILNYNLCFLQ